MLPGLAAINRRREADIAAAPSDAAWPARDVKGADNGAAPGERIRLDFCLVHAVSIGESIDADFCQRGLSRQGRGESQSESKTKSGKDEL